MLNNIIHQGNANLNHYEISLCISPRMAKIKKTYLAPSVTEDVEQLERSCIAGEMVQPLWEIIWHFLIKPNIRLNYDPKILLLHI